MIFIAILTAVSLRSYTGYIETNYGWILWEKKTWTGSSRASSEVTAAPSTAECPVVWRQWPSDNQTIGKTVVLTTSMSMPVSHIYRVSQKKWGFVFWATFEGVKWPQIKKWKIRDPS